MLGVFGVLSFCYNLMICKFKRLSGLIMRQMQENIL